MKNNIIFLKYWAWLPRALKFLIVGFSGIILDMGLLYVIPYSESALYGLAVLDFISICFLLMGVLYMAYDFVKSFRNNRKQKT